MRGDHVEKYFSHGYYVFNKHFYFKDILWKLKGISKFIFLICKKNRKVSYGSKEFFTVTFLFQKKKNSIIDFFRTPSLIFSNMIMNMYLKIPSMFCSFDMSFKKLKCMRKNVIQMEIHLFMRFEYIFTSRNFFLKTPSFVLTN